MRVIIVGVTSLLLAAAFAGPVSAQTVTAELDVTAGYSTDKLAAVGSQLRLFGDLGGGWEYLIEGTWASVRDMDDDGDEDEDDSGGRTSYDAFGAAYPYDKKIHPMEAYLQKTIQPGSYLVGVRLGRYRTPFGIYNRSDHAYNGFLRSPLIRHGDYGTLSNNFIENGGSVIVGRPKLFVEASLGAPGEREAADERRQGLNGVVRVQGSLGPFIVGASHIQTQPSAAFWFARGSTIFSGVDVRWMVDGVQLRGEWLDGHAFDYTRTFGGYIDAIVHRPMMGPVTAVLRAERLDYEAGPFSSFPRRYTAGARIQLTRVVAGQINVIRQHGLRGESAGSSLDFALTFTTRR